MAGQDMVFHDTDTAIEWAEDRLLEDQGRELGTMTAFRSQRWISSGASTSTRLMWSGSGLSIDQ